MPVARVTISKNPEELLKLAGKIFAQHVKLGASSPLNSLTWNVIGDTVDPAMDWHDKAEEYKKLSEAAYEQRDKLLQPIDTIVKQSRDVLKGVYRAEPKKLGEFGFDVADSPKASKAKPNKPE